MIILMVIDDSYFEFSNQDFTIDFWIYPFNITSRFIIGKRAVSASLKLCGPFFQEGGDALFAIVSRKAQGKQISFIT